MGIDLPEPSEIELLGENARDPLTVLRAYLERKEKHPDPKAAEILQAAFSGVELLPQWEMGGSQYQAQIREILEKGFQNAGVFRMNR